MASIKVFHRTDAPLGGTTDYSRHISIHELVEEFTFVGWLKFATSSTREDEIHPEDAFDEAIDRFTYGPGASREFLKREVRPLVPGDILLRHDTGEAVMITKDGYDVVDLKDVKGRTDLDSDGTPDPEKTFPGYDPGSNEVYDPEKHSYDAVEDDEEESEKEEEGLGELFG